uniref:Integrase, catalytic region, zinc finger, CCHC-type, peptidase aspartic, catalytic n=1 Tax=Tanacetum cinerariifolium TaxID=118510 RepID=A0A6L2KW08_TANCI|nr:hypothetical protein [Tanacetum cinerariifolium]
MILESVEHGPLIWPTVKENGVIRTKKYAELSDVEKIQADCDMKATNIILQGLPTDVYSPVNHHRVAKDLWERVQLLMQCTSLTKQEIECKLYAAFDKFTHIKGESLHMYYLRFTQLINNMNIYKMNMEQFQVNTKFLNSLPPEWSKFLTDVKLVKDFHTSSYDQLHAYLEQHELHANEVRLMRDDPIACLNKAIALLTAVASSKFPSTNNQLRTSSNTRNQATTQDDKNQEPLPEDILRVTTLRHTGSHYPKTYWESLPEDILGVITQKHIGSHYPKTYWKSLPEDILGVTPLKGAWTEYVSGGMTS